MPTDISVANARGRNVEPRSSVLDIQTLDTDVSGFAVAPEDGEWVYFRGALQEAAQGVATLAADGASLCMVWSEVGRSDTQGTGRERVPVIFRKSFHCVLALYNYTIGNLPLPGMFLTIAANTATSINGSTTRLLANADGALLPGEHWVVGHVLSAPAVAGDPLEVLIYDAPRFVTTT